ncbi:uncharacterized protein ASCRUDRAFT_73197 [Ascoidea rubescens DSM 1968]|uniref:Complex I-B15 n=1 Tax=Ascoidea rubescens DSM 1968 TaxID=1344418 RepID=A0A1D2VP18_9ASCO|nr:hypothetical protein ASCRUDRAFT_73197 [Ascoidea rubescens DSM 1968]ODV63307.1 hypothetical protein ASCRUDRAFT_73197 [Ascoidea rubescens DSM 1968]
MAGHNDGHHLLHKDAAFERFYKYRENYGQIFRMTKGAAKTNLIWMGLFPAALIYIGAKTDGWSDYVPASRRTAPIFKEYVPKDF